MNIIFLIRKFLAGKATQDEQRKLEEWWETSLHDSQSLDSISEQEWQLLKQEMESNIRSIIQKRETIRAKKTIQLITWNTGWRVAASLLFLIGVAVSTYYLTTDTIIETAYGEKKTITLPDESTVVLNGNSSIRYARGWSNNEDRSVWLEGEAFFSVKHTKNDNRFTVHASNNLTIEVLGTQFDVTNRKGETSVILQEGSVRLEDSKSTYTMKPNEMVRYSKTSAAFIPQKVVAIQKVSWKTNLILYTNESVESILEKLSDSHGLKVIFENEEVRNEIFNGSIPSDSITVVFDKIEKLYGVMVTLRDDGTYVIQ